MGVDASESFGSSTGGEGDSVLHRRLDLGGFDNSGECGGLGLGLEDRSSDGLGVRSGDGLKRSSGLGGNVGLDCRDGCADGGLGRR